MSNYKRIRKDTGIQWSDFPDEYLSVGQPFELKVAQGLIPHHSWVDKFGRNKNITTGTDPEDVWEIGGLYNYDADDTAPITSLISTSAADTMNVMVIGQDINRKEVIQTIALNGTTRVELPTPLWRVYRMISPYTKLTGTVYCYIGTGGVPAVADTRAVMYADTNQTLMALYTIPLGKVGFLFKGSAEMSWEGGIFSGTEEANCQYASRRLGGVFTVKRTFTLISAGSSQFADKRTFPDPIPSGTDIKICVEEVSATMGINGAFDILLIDDVLFNEEYLQSIGQPGY